MRDQTNSFEYTEGVLEELGDNAQKLMDSFEPNTALQGILDKMRVKERAT